MSLKEITENIIHTYEDLLEIEEQTGVRHELYDDTLRMMAGGTGKHSRISLELASILKDKLKDKGCVVYNTDMRLKISKKEKDNYYYPDVSVKCSNINDDKDYIENPSLLVEVLSPSTAGVDRFVKLNDYLTINNLKGYLIVRQDVKEIEVFYKNNEDIKVDLFKANDIVKIEDWLEFAVNDVYDGILE